MTQSRDQPQQIESKKLAYVMPHPFSLVSKFGLNLFGSEIDFFQKKPCFATLRPNHVTYGHKPNLRQKKSS